MPQITVRALDSNGDPQEGNGLNDFLTDIDAVGQIIGTSLKLFQGEWWEDLQAGVPMFQQVLGQQNASQTSALAAVLQMTIADCPYVNTITNLQVGYTGTNRKLTFSCNVQTDFGTIYVSNGVTS